MTQAGQGNGPRDEVRTAEVVGSLSLATDLSIGFPFEHGLTTALLGLRLAERIGADAALVADVGVDALVDSAHGGQRAVPGRSLADWA